jgi:phosphatidylglycerophosphatase C
MEKVNVYDFDKTILPYDSTEAFLRWCARRYPRSLLRSAAAAPLLPLWLIGKSSKTEVKEAVFRFLTLIPDVQAEVAAFWAVNLPNINNWYLWQKRPDDIVISASPEFLLRPVAEELGFRLIASRYSPYTGRAEGANNDGAEKVRRLRELYPDVVIDEFYSDSLHDSPLARLARSAWLVKGSALAPWPK